MAIFPIFYTTPPITNHYQHTCITVVGWVPHQPQLLRPTQPVCFGVHLRAKDLDSTFLELKICRLNVNDFYLSLRRVVFLVSNPRTDYLHDVIFELQSKFTIQILLFRREEKDNFHYLQTIK